jgi:general stress protein YciG
MSIHTRGFASMSLEKRQQISRKGGKAAHQQGVAHEWTVAEARTAGARGATPPRTIVPTRNRRDDNATSRLIWTRSECRIR